MGALARSGQPIQLKENETAKNITHKDRAAIAGECDSISTVRRLYRYKFYSLIKSLRSAIPFYGLSSFSFSIHPIHFGSDSIVFVSFNPKEC